MERPGILYLLPFLHFGVGRLVVDIMRAAETRGARVYLATGLPSGELCDDPALVEEVSAFAAGTAATDLFGRGAEAMETAEDEIARLSLEWQIDAAHAFTAIAAASAVSHTRVVATVVGWSPSKSPWQRSMDAAILRRCDVVTGVSDAVIDELWQAGLERPDVKLIRNGVDIPASPGRRQRPARMRTLGVMAQLIERKGVDVLLRALALVPDCPFRRLVIAGSGEAEASLRELAAALSLPCEVDWAGHMSVDRFLDQIDLAVVPSRSDALPMLLLQAMAAGVPVIGTLVGGIPEAVRDGVDGILVPPDDPVLLSLALWSAAESPDLARARAESGRRRIAQEFSLDGMLAGYLACYNEVGVRLRRAPATAGQDVRPGSAA
jgi:glycosyltransferase involved in cell wall biosynthesis